MKYRFLFIDLDDTLFDFGAAERVAIRRAYEEAGIEVTDALLARYHDINQAHWERYERGETTREALLVDRHDALFREFSIPVRGIDVEARYRAYLGIGHYFIDGAEDCLRYLKARGYLLYLASNGVAETQYSRLESAGILPFFEQIFISETTGSNKPQKAYFDYCFAHIPGFEKDRALLIGDSLSSDILGGKRAGIATCWFNRFGKTAPPELTPDYEIRSLKELQSIL